MISGPICPPRRRRETPGAPYGRPFRGGDCSECGKPIWCKCKMQAEKQETCCDACSRARQRRIHREKRESLGPPPPRTCVICGRKWRPVNRKVRRTTCGTACQCELHRRQNDANRQFRRAGDPLPEEIERMKAEIRRERELDAVQIVRMPHGQEYAYEYYGPD